MQAFPLWKIHLLEPAEGLLSQGIVAGKEAFQLRIG